MEYFILDQKRVGGQNATSLQDCRNSKFVIFQEKNLKVYKSHKLNRITHLELNRITQ